jgi:hypothetical protein
MIRKELAAGKAYLKETRKILKLRYANFSQLITLHPVKKVRTVPLPME